MEIPDKSTRKHVLRRFESDRELLDCQMRYEDTYTEQNVRIYYIGHRRNLQHMPQRTLAQMSENIYLGQNKSERSLVEY